MFSFQMVAAFADSTIRVWRLDQPRSVAGGRGVPSGAGTRTGAVADRATGVANGGASGAANGADDDGDAAAGGGLGTHSGGGVGDGGAGIAGVGGGSAGIPGVGSGGVAYPGRAGGGLEDDVVMGGGVGGDGVATVAVDVAVGGVIGSDEPRSGGATADVLVGHSTSVTRVAVSSDGDYILSGSLDGSARLWRVGERLSRVRQRALPCADVVAMSCKSGVVVCLCECGVDLCHHTGAECMC